MYQLRALSGVVTTGQVCLHKQGLGRTVCPLKQFTRSRRVCHARGSAASRSSQGKSHSQQNSGDFWEKHTVQEKAQAAGQVAGKRVKQTYQAVEGGVKQAAKTVNSRFDLQRKAQKTRERVVQQLEEVDDRFQLRRKARTTLADAQRQLPRLRRQYNAFSKTLPGKVLWFAFLIWGFRSGLFFKLLSIAGLLLLVAPLVLVPLLNGRIAKRAAAAEAQQQAQRQQQQQQAQNPFSNFASFGNMKQRQQQQQASMSQKPSPYVQQAGPVIDAEWTSIDEE